MPNIIRFEIHASDPQKLIDFYTALFGWSFTRVEPAGYWHIENAGLGGGMVQRPNVTAAGAQSINAFICTVDVDSVEESLAKAVSMGGEVALPVMTVPGIGLLAYIKDPDGNVVALLELDASQG